MIEVLSSDRASDHNGCEGRVVQPWRICEQPTYTGSQWAHMIDRVFVDAHAWRQERGRRGTGVALAVVMAGINDALRRFGTPVTTPPITSTAILTALAKI